MANNLTKKKTIMLLASVMLALSGCGTSGSETSLRDLNIETETTVRVWLKISSDQWNEENPLTHIHYTGSNSGDDTLLPGRPLEYDEANALYFSDIPLAMTTFMFTGVDRNGDYLLRQSAALSNNAVNRQYEITAPGTVEDGIEQYNGSAVTFTIQTPTRVTSFITSILNAKDKEEAFKRVNYYYFGLTTYEQEVYAEMKLNNGKTGMKHLNALRRKYDIGKESYSSLQARLNSDLEALSVNNEETADFDLQVFSASGAYINWQSLDPTTIRLSREKAYVYHGDYNVSVNLEATIHVLAEKGTKTFTIVVEGENDILATTITWNIHLPFQVPEGRKLKMGTDQNSWSPANEEWGSATKVSDRLYTFTKVFIGEESSETFFMLYKWVLYNPGETNQWFGVELRSGNRMLEIDYGVSVQIVDDYIDEWENYMNTEISSIPLSDGMLTTIPFSLPGLSDRRLRIWTPEGYDKTNTSKKYPVIYLQDGQNMFQSSTSFSGEWKIDESIRSLMNTKSDFNGVIAVGIDNSPNRMGEYMYPNGFISYQTTTPVGDVYMDALVNNIKPYVDRNYNTLTNRANTWLAGSSMGGLISFFGGIERLETFGGIMAFSTSTQLVADGATNVPNKLHSLDNNLLKNTRFFLYVGTSSDGDKTWPDNYKNYLLNTGVASANIQTYSGVGYSHNEYAWSKHFPIALSWAMGYGL